MFEKGQYKNLTNEQIKKNLEKSGYNPILISENPNDVLNTHQHPQSHILVGINGEMKVVLGEKEYFLRRGDKITINPQVAHAAYIGPEGCQYFWIEY